MSKRNFSQFIIFVLLITPLYIITINLSQTNTNNILINQEIKDNDYRIFWLQEIDNQNINQIQIIRTLTTIGGFLANVPLPLVEKYSISGYDLSNIKIRLDTTQENENIEPLASTSNKLSVNPIWDAGYNGSDAVIAVIDTGIDFNHPALAGKKFLEKSFIEPKYGYETNRGPEDNHGHGTMVASLIAGNRSLDNSDPNNPDKRGIAFDSKLVNAKVATGGAIITPAGLVAAIDWAASIDEVDVINISMGEPESGAGEDILEHAVNLAVLSGKVVVVSSGNNGKNGAYTQEPHSIGSPGSSSEAITVGAIGYSNNLASYSSEGPTFGWEAKPDVVAPGEHIPVATRGGGYSYVSGTSFSTPLIAGVAGLLISSLKKQNINYNPGSIKAALSKTATSIGLEWMQQGNGLVNTTKAFELLTQSNYLAISYPEYNPYISRREVAAGASISFPVTLVSSSMDSWQLHSITGNGTSLIMLDFDQIKGGYTQILPIKIYTTINTSLGLHLASISLLSPDNIETLFNIEIKIIPATKNKLLIDLVHSPWPSVMHNSGIRVERILGYDIADFVTLLKNNEIWVDELIQGNIEENTLENYDILWIPSAFSQISPAYYDHELERDTILTTKELFAIHKFISNGGKLLVDYGGAPVKIDHQDYKIKSDEDSLKSLLSLIGIEVNNLNTDDGLYNTHSLNTSIIGKSSTYNSVGGGSQLHYGIPITSSSNLIRSIGYVGQNTRSYISNIRNWRDRAQMIQKSDNGPYDFANSVIEWLVKEDGIQSISYLRTSEGTLIQGKIIINEEINQDDLILRIKNNGIPISLENIQIDQAGEFSTLLPSIFEGEINIYIEYLDYYLSIDKRLNFDIPNITLIDKQERSDNIIEWKFEISDNSPIPKYNIQVLINGNSDLDGLGYSFYNNVLTVSLDMSSFNLASNDILIDIQVIDSDGHFTTFSNPLNISTTISKTITSNLSLSSKTSDSVFYSSFTFIGTLLIIITSVKYVRKHY